jgi:hypothetical protein
VIAERDEFYRQADRLLLGEEMFEECLRVAREAPDPTPEQIALIGRIFGPGMRLLAQREAEAPRELQQAA